MTTLSLHRQEQLAILARVTDAQWATMRTQDIADSLFMPWRVVHDFRIDNHKPKQPRRPGSGRPPKHDWRLYDPSLSDHDNAFILNAQLGAVRWHRRHKIPAKKKK